MDKRIKIKCPVCGAVLKVKNAPGIEGKQVSCPVCNKKLPFTAFTLVNEQPYTPSGDATQCAFSSGGTEQTRVAGGGDATEINLSAAPVGVLHLEGTTCRYPLRVGRNVVGRKAESSHADFQIPCQSRKNSREHLLIEVSAYHGQVTRIVSLYKQEVGTTHIGTSQLCYGDRVYLQIGDRIRLPEGVLVLEQ